MSHKPKPSQGSYFLEINTVASKANADASVPSKEKLIKAKVKSQRLKKKEEETLLIYTAQGSPLRRKKLSVINGSPEQKMKHWIHYQSDYFQSKKA